MNSLVKENIVINQDTRFGRPVIKGTRISVFDVLNWMANGMSINDILADFPELNQTQIMACLRYAANKENNHHIAV